MNFKQFLARLFHIQPSDLHDHEQSSGTRSELDDQVRREIKKQVKQEISRVMKMEILSEIRILLEEKKTGAVTSVDHPISPAQESDRTTKLDIEHPLIQEESKTLDHHLPQVADEEPILPVEIPRPLKKPKVAASLAKKGLRLGIDFGTTTTSVSVKVGEELPIAIPIGKDGVTGYMPSVVYINPGKGNWVDRVVVGEDAESQGDETKRIRSIKRCLECEGDRCKEVAAQGQLRPPPWCFGDGSIRINENESVPPSQVAFLIIQEAMDRAKKYLRDNLGWDFREEDIVEIPLNMGCGARFSQVQREILVSIAQRMGFTNIRIRNIVEEPILAGFTFARYGDHPEGYSLIYDFGGGTLDIAVIDVAVVAGQPKLTVLSTSGDPWLGGDDIDTIIYQEFIRQIAVYANKKPSVLEKNLTWLDRSNIRSRARRAKELLTEQPSYNDTYNVEGLSFVDLSLDVEKFEALLEESGLVQRSLEAVHKALKLALALDQACKSDLFDIRVFQNTLSEAGKFVQRVIPVGGITKIPYVRRKLTDLFGGSKIISEKVVEPILAVAIGAAFKKEQKHFSISVPPFGFILKYRDHKTRGEDSSITLLEPFEYYEFYKSINSVALPRHWLDGLTVNRTYFDARLILEYADDHKQDELDQLGNLLEGNYEFSVGLDGDIYLNKVGGQPMLCGRIPFLHPLQLRISEERKKRARKTKKEMDARRDDSMISMTFDN